MTDTGSEKLFHPEHPGSPYTMDDALYDLNEAQGQIWAAERAAPSAQTHTLAAAKKLARVQEFLEGDK